MEIKSFTNILFTTQNKSFHDTLIYLVQQRKFLQHTLYFYFLLTNSETYEPIKQHIHTYLYLQSWGGVPYLEYQSDHYYVNTSALGTVSGEPMET